jgi:hypothetical protein
MAGGELWVGDFAGTGTAQVVSFSTQEGNWRLGTLTAAGSPTVTFADIGNTHGFGVAGNAVWQGRFSGGAGAELLFYNAGDSHWWLGGVTGADPQISWTNPATQAVPWLPGAPVWVVDWDGTGQDRILAYNAADSTWWAGAFAAGGFSWEQIGQTPGLPALSVTTAAGQFLGTGQQLLGYVPGPALAPGSWQLISLSSSGEPVDVQPVEVEEQLEALSFSYDHAGLWFVAPFAPGGADAILACDIFTGDWVLGWFETPDGAPQISFAKIGNSSNMADLATATGWLAPPANNALPELLVYSPGTEAWALGTPSGSGQEVDALTFSPVAVSQPLFGPTAAQITIAQDNLAALQAFNDYVYNHTSLDFGLSLQALTEPTQDPGIATVVTLFTSVVAAAAAFVPDGSPVWWPSASAFIGTFTNGLLASWASDPPASIAIELAGWADRYQKTSSALDKQLAGYADDVPGNWATSFTLNGQTSVISDLAFTHIPVETVDPCFEDMAAASHLALFQTLWKQILLDRFVVREQPPMDVDGDQDAPPITWAQNYYKKYPNAYVEWHWTSGPFFAGWKIDNWEIAYAPGTGYTPTPLSPAASAMLFIDSTPGVVINADGYYTRNQVFAGLGLPTVGFPN